MLFDDVLSGPAPSLIKPGNSVINTLLILMDRLIWTPVLTSLAWEIITVSSNLDTGEFSLELNPHDQDTSSVVHVFAPHNNPVFRHS